MTQAESPEERFGRAPDRDDQMSPYERGYRDGYKAAMDIVIGQITRRTYPRNSDDS